MNPHEAFLRAIIESPDDDAPRLMFADWLDEHGDEARAEFIRVQCRLATMDEHDPERVALANREEVLQTVLGETWHPEVPPDERFYEHTFRRGFLARLVRKAADWLESPDRYDHITPVEGLYLQEAEELLEPIAACEHLAQLRWLMLTFLMLDPGGGIEAFYRSRYLTGLEILTLSDGSLTLDGARQLASADLPNLTTLEVSFNEVGGDGAAALVASASLSRLSRLSLWNNQLGPTAVEALARERRLARLWSLDLRCNGIGARGVRALARSPHTAGLRELALGANGLTDAGVKAVAESPHLAGLVSLGLGNNDLGPEATAALAGSKHLRSLRRLDLVQNRLGMNGVKRLVAGEWGSLHDLDLSDCRLGDAGALALAASPAVAGLRRLNLGHNKITAAGAQALAASEHFRSLTELELRDNKVGDAGVEALAGSPNLQTVTRLGLAANGIGVKGARAIAASPYLRNLVHLDLDGNSVGTAGAKALAASPHLPGPPCFLLEILDRNRVGKVGEKALRDRWGSSVH